MNLDRGEYGEIYHHTFGKLRGREACQEGWRRWQKALAANLGAIVLHPDGTPMPAPDPMSERQRTSTDVSILQQPSTPPEAVHALLRAERLPPIIWEPARVIAALRQGA